MLRFHVHVGFVLALVGAACGKDSTRPSQNGGAGGGTSGGSGSSGVAGTGAGGAAGTSGVAGTTNGAAGAPDAGVSCPPPSPRDAGTPSDARYGGFVLECPASPPSGCCSDESLSCAYPTKSCVCSRGAWSCMDCPATRPPDGAPTPDDRRIWMRCKYDDVTCSYPAGMLFGTNVVYMSTSWVCGVCPPDKPATGEACGNTGFECGYGAETCHCGGTTGWRCAAPLCDAKVSASNSGVCLGPGHFTCRYPDVDQNCVCGTAIDTRRCSCPTTRPADGSSCVALPGQDGAVGGCMYGDIKCTCVGGTTWSCPVPACPTAQPAPGSSCATRLSCSYGQAICACDGASWACS